MKTKPEKIVEEVGHIVYRLDLIPENDQDKEALTRLESQLASHARAFWSRRPVKKTGRTYRS